jgi:hypothetical protein
MEASIKQQSESQKKASDKYRENNKEKVNEQRKEYYKKKKEEDPDFLEKKREKAREYYKRRKEKQSLTESDSDSKESVKDEIEDIGVKETATFVEEKIEVKPVEQEIIKDEINNSITLQLKKPVIRKSKKSKEEKEK